MPLANHKTAKCEKSDVINLLSMYCQFFNIILYVSLNTSAVLKLLTQKTKFLRTKHVKTISLIYFTVLLYFFKINRRMSTIMCFSTLCHNLNDANSNNFNSCGSSFLILEILQTSSLRKLFSYSLHHVSATDCEDVWS